MPLSILPSTRLVDELSRHGFHVWVKYDKPDDYGSEAVTTYFVSRDGPIIAGVTTQFVFARTVTYGTDDLLLVELASRFGTVWPAGPVSPDLPVGAVEVTRSAGADVWRRWRGTFLFTAVFLLVLWWSGCVPRA